MDDFGRQLENIFDVQRSKSDSKSMLRASQKLIPRYITELEDVNRCRYLRQLEKHLKLSQKLGFSMEILITGTAACAKRLRYYLLSTRRSLELEGQACRPFWLVSSSPI